VIPPLAASSDPVIGGGTDSRRQTRGRDVIEISEQAKHLNAAKAGQSECADRAGKVDQGAFRIRADIGARVNSGFYNSEEVVEQVAGRLLDLFGV
jgi:hypothetical protein